MSGLGYKAQEPALALRGKCLLSLHILYHASHTMGQAAPVDPRHRVSCGLSRDHSADWWEVSRSGTPFQSLVGKDWARCWGGGCCTESPVMAGDPHNHAKK